MMIKRISSLLGDISAKLDILIKAQSSRPPGAGESTSGQSKPVAYRLDDAKMQEGISNLMGYDPFGKKRSEETWQ